MKWKLDNETKKTKKLRNRKTNKLSYPHIFNERNYHSLGIGNTSNISSKKSLINQLFMVSGSWLMAQGPWPIKFGARARGLGDPATSFYWP